MLKPKALKKGDKIAIVSLSSGMLGEQMCAHNLEIGLNRLKKFGLEPVLMPNALKGIAYLKEHPEKRAEDLKEAFLDKSIKAIICAIGGDDTFRLLPYLMNDEFKEIVQNNPKIFTGFSDTTINHLMFYQLGLQTFYGPAFITDLGEIAKDMLLYTQRWFESFLKDRPLTVIGPSLVWYEERKDFSVKAINTDRVYHFEARGYELLQGSPIFQGKLLGGCLESLYDCLEGKRYPEEKIICDKYKIFPELTHWQNKILFIETSEACPKPEVFKNELMRLKETGIFKVINGIIVGKPQDEKYYEEYKNVLVEVIADKTLPILYNINFGHATPRCVLPYNLEVLVDSQNYQIKFLEPVFANN